MQAVLGAYGEALLRVDNRQSQLLALVSPRSAVQPCLDQQTWGALTALERSRILVKWPADEVTRGIVRSFLIPTDDGNRPLLETFEELVIAARLFSDGTSPVLVATVSERISAAGLGQFLDIADQAPTIPIILLVDQSIFNSLQSAAEKGDRAAAFIRDGAIAIERFSTPTTTRNTLGALPTNVADGVLALENEGVNEHVVDAFIAASTIDPVVEPNTFDSLAEEFLSMLLEGDPRTAGLFKSQGQPGFLMNNNQPATVDFLCPSLGIAVEVDGPHHFQQDQFRRDRRKDRELQKAGYLILRFLAEDVTARFEEVRTQIQAAVAWRLSFTDREP
jgi:hypothetical protein